MLWKIDEWVADIPKKPIEIVHKASSDNVINVAVISSDLIRSTTPNDDTKGLPTRKWNEKKKIANACCNWYDDNETYIKKVSSYQSPNQQILCNALNAKYTQQNDSYFFYQKKKEEEKCAERMKSVGVSKKKKQLKIQEASA